MQGFAHLQDSLWASAGSNWSPTVPFLPLSGSVLASAVLGGFCGDQGCGPQLSGRQWEAMVALLMSGVHGREQDDITIRIALAARSPLRPSFPRWPWHLQASIEIQAQGWGQGSISLQHDSILATQTGQGASSVHIC